LFKKSKNVIPRNFPFHGMEKIPRKNFCGKNFLEKNLRKIDQASFLKPA
jgi:hypothetical protein